MRSSDIHPKAISQEVPHDQTSIIKIENTYLKFHSNLPGYNELTYTTASMEIMYVFAFNIIHDVFICTSCEHSLTRKTRTRLISLTHWGRVTHICVSKLTIIGSDNGLSPGRRQAIIWTNAGILLIGPWGTNFSEILIEIHTFSFNKMHLKMSAKWRPFCPGLNVLKWWLLPAF